MDRKDALKAWGTLLHGRKPLLSIELTKECPLRCPGCYAYDPQHLGGAVTLRQLSDEKGDQLIRRVLASTRIGPCQFGGNPDCSQCGCAASMGLHSLANHAVAGISLRKIFTISNAVGKSVRQLRAA